jgi:transcriptional regulator with XRE-family HTH domain
MSPHVPVFTIDGEPAVPSAQIQQELGWTRQRLRSAQQACDSLDGEPLALRLGRHVDTGTEEPGLTQREFENLKDRINQAATGELVYQGVCRWSLERSLRELSIPGVLIVSDRQLISWLHYDCCRALGGKLDAIALRLRPQDGLNGLWFCKDQIIAIKTNLLRRAKVNRELGKLFGGRLRELRKQRSLTLRDLAAKADVCVESLILWEKGKRLPRPRIATRLAQALGVLVEHLKLPKRNFKRPGLPQHAFEGVWRDDKGRPIAYTIQKAAPLLKRDVRTVKDYTEQLPKVYHPIFPKDKRLPTEPRQVPGSRLWWKSISHGDLETFKNGIGRLSHSARRHSKLRTARQICDQHKIMSHGDRIIVRAFLHKLARAHVVKATHPPDVLRRRATLFDPKEIDEFAAGRGLLELAKQPFTVHVANGQAETTDTATPTSPPRRRGKRGPVKKESTREVEEYCYRRKMAGDKLSAIAAAVRRIYGREKFNDSQVSTYASRHEEDLAQTP